MPTPQPWFPDTHPCWLPAARGRHLAAARVEVDGGGPAGATVLDEVASLRAELGLGEPAADAPRWLFTTAGAPDGLRPGGFAVHHDGADRVVRAPDGAGLLHGFYRALVVPDVLDGTVEDPAVDLRMLDSWDNMTADGVMGSVERGYAGDSVLFRDGRVVEDLTRVRGFLRLMASVGLNAWALNNVNVHDAERGLVDEHLPDVARVADLARSFGVRVWLSVDFSSPISLGGLDVADPLDERVAAFWRETADRLYRAVPDLGGFLVKADSEGRPGPHAYGRDHADGANVLARALAPHGGTVLWRCFVYDHRQDWRDRSTDRARAAHDHFVPLDGRFDDNVVLQVKNGPMDFQVREPVSPLLGALRETTTAVEFQVTQEYTGQQQHVCYLAPQWSEVLRFDFGEGTSEPRTVADCARGGVVAVSNVGDSWCWTGHPLAQANLFAFGRLAWDPRLDPDALLGEWSRATFGDDEELLAGVHDVVAGSWRTYEDLTAPLGVGWMVSPHHHYGPDVEGYEYTAWGTYHFADRDGVGVDRTVATGTGYAGQYPPAHAARYEDLATCPEELLLFFHHVGYGHRLSTGETLVQRIYDTHFAGVEDVRRRAARWEEVADRVDERTAQEVRTRLAEQVRSAQEWCDRITTYFHRASGAPDAHGRRIF
ncbi:alpha-glucuronidase [Kineococcus terrestris]|uniref:alpha-glucuronidase n=1 Tax=Kineococcus terrestris TaxID=2044856 RepID=UPI0034DB6BC6